MAIGGDDDTVAGSAPTSSGGPELPARVADRYEIVRWLGGGGMGRVYEAIDTELGERVALKVLRGGLSADALERFRREVRLTRRIQHPNVARMFDIGEHVGEKFLTMELVDGEPLARETGRAFETGRLVALAKQLCAGLEAAHDKGVIHRDLKPDNVLIERATDRAVITDFGIARSVDEAAVTQAGSVIGTPRYMAPEQLGGGEVDARSDLFSLGVMLYELATGQRPWQGDHAIAIAVAQTTHPVPPIRSSAIPPGLAAIVMRCLELAPAARPASARELASWLDQLAVPSAAATSTTRLEKPAARPSRATLRDPAPTVATATTSLAVLPLACAPGDEYLADGVLEDLIDTLSATRGLRVRPAGIVRSAAAPDPRVLGRELEVEHVVTGSVRRTPGGGVRVAARLLGVGDGFQIWAHRADGAEAEILELGEQLARGIAGALSTRAATNARPTDPRTVELFLRARAELRLFWGGHAIAATDLFDQAYELSPDCVPVAGARAFASVQAWMMSAEPRFAERARAAIRDGLAIDAPEAYLASALYKLNSNDAVSAATDLGTALVRAPMLAQAHEMAGRVLMELGALAESRQHLTNARSLDPLRAHLITSELARLDMLEGYTERAERAATALANEPDRAMAQLGAIQQVRFAAWRGDLETARRGALMVAPRMGGFASRITTFVNEAVATGNLDEDAWQRIVPSIDDPELPTRSHLLALQILGEVALLLGRTELAYRTFEQANRIGLLDIANLDRCPLFDRIADEARFETLRGRVRERADRVLSAFRAALG